MDDLAMNAEANLVDPILAWAGHAGAAIEQDGQAWSYAELGRRMAAVAAGLRAHGRRPGDVVALSLADPGDSLVAFLGAVLGGFVPVQIDPTDVESERARLIAMAGAVLQVAAGAAEGVTLAGLLAAGAGSEPAAVRAPGGDRPALINLSSGTTGLRKAVPLSHTQQATRARQTTVALGIARDDRLLPILPVHFVFGRQAAVRMLLAGATVVLRPLPADAAGFVDLVARERITHLEATPGHLRHLLEHLPDTGRPAMPGLRRLVASTAMLGGAERVAVRRRLTANLHITYGSNEMGIVACALPADLDHDPMTVGRALPACEIVVTDEAGTPLPAGTVGEVRVRTRNAAVGYVGNAEASDRSFRDGWFHTGDAGRLDAAGRLFLTGRLDDRINFGGIKIYPIEIEEVLRAFPGIVDAAVVGLPSRRHQQVAVAAVEGPAELDLPALRRHCAQRLAASRMPQMTMLFPALPRTGSGKVDGPALRQAIRDRLPRRPQE